MADGANAGTRADIPVTPKPPAVLELRDAPRNIRRRIGRC